MKYCDPYKDAKYGYLKGDKTSEAYFIQFSEAKLYETDNGYSLLANVSSYSGVVRAYKPELSLKPGICAIPIYEKEYEIREKNKATGEYEGIKCQPSLFEQNLPGLFLLEYADAIGADSSKSVKGSIAFLPDYQLRNLTNEEVVKLLNQNCKLELIESTGTLPEYVSYGSNSSKKGNYNNYNRMTPSEKAKWIKDDLCLAIRANGFNSDMALCDVVEQFVAEKKESEIFLSVYFDLVKNIAS